MIGPESYLQSGEAFNGFGTGSEGNLNSLQKALTAGYAISNQTGGAALRVESLDASLKITTYNENHIKFWRKIPKSPAYSTVEEYNQVSAYGNSGFAWIAEGQLPASQDSTYTRKTAKIKYVGTTRAVTHVAATFYPAHGDVIALQINDGIKWLLLQIEQGLFTGNSSLAFSGDGLQWDGLDSLIDPTSVLDLAGAPLTEDAMEQATQILVDNGFAFPTDVFLSNLNLSDLTKTMYPRERVALPAPQNGIIGQAVTGMATNAGTLALNATQFVKKYASPPAAATSTQAPTAPASIAGARAAATTGNFTKGQAAAGVTSNFGYAVTAANQYGESAPVFVGGAAVVALTNSQKLAGDKITLTITNSGAVATVPEYFKIYRTADLGASASTAPTTNLSAYSLVLQVPAASQANSGTTTADDLNYYLPGCSTAYVGQMTEDVITFRQLLPMLKMDLAVVSPQFQFMILLYGTPLLFAPKKWLSIINVGQLVRT